MDDEAGHACSPNNARPVPIFAEEPVQKVRLRIIAKVTAKTGPYRGGPAANIGGRSRTGQHQSRVSLRERAKSVAGMRGPIMDGLVYRETRGGGSDRTIVAKRLKARSQAGMRKVNRGRIWRSRLMPTQMSCVCGTALQFFNPASFSSVRNVFPLFCVARASCGRKWLPYRYPLASMRATR
jgi:hypothetical protein